MLQVGEKVPTNIELLDMDGNFINLQQYLGKYIVLYFYPKDNTPGCTKEACSFRDYNDEIKALEAEVIGVSKDSIESHKKFQEKHQLNFTLLSDPDAKLQKAFGVWGPKKFMGREFLGTHRSTFIIDPEGKIVKVWEKVEVKDHAKEVYDALKVLLNL